MEPVDRLTAKVVFDSKVSKLQVNKCISLVGREMIQIQGTHADVDACPMQEVSSLD